MSKGSELRNVIDIKRCWAQTERALRMHTAEEHELVVQRKITHSKLLKEVPR